MIAGSACAIACFRDIEIELELGSALALDDLCRGQTRDVRVQLVGGLERERHPPRPSVREEQGLQHLVRAVGREDLIGGNRVKVGDGTPQRAGGAVGVAMPVDAAELGRERRLSTREAAVRATRSC